MAKTLTEVETYTATVTVPEDGDALNALSVEAGFQDLADRTAYLKAETDSIVTLGYALKVAQSSGQAFDPTSQDTAPVGVQYSDDGTKLYVMGTTNNRVYQYSLATAWDVSTATYDSVDLNVGSQDGSCQGFCFGDSGSKLYMIGSTSDVVYQYTLPTPWSLTGASYASLSKSVTTEASTPTCVAFSADGTKMYVGDQTTGDVYRYTLSTAWNVSTASYDSMSLDTSGEDATPRAVDISADGRRLAIIGQATDSAYVYVLATPYDLTTATPAGTYGLDGLTTITLSGCFGGGGRHLLALQNAGSVYHHYAGVAMRI